MKKGKSFIIMTLLVLLYFTSNRVYAMEIGELAQWKTNLIEYRKQKEIRESLLEEAAKEAAKIKEITLSFAGDCTLGTYYGQGEWNRFDKVAEKEGYDYFLKHVKPIFEADDLTVINLEGPLTTGGKREDKQFAIKGDPAYTKILTSGSVEAVSLANNHTYDYGQEGVRQTKEALDKAGIDYFIGEKIVYQEINGIKVALIGEKGWDSSKYTKDRIKKYISQAKSQADLVIMMFHWGIEREFYPNQAQKDLGYLSIDEGADLVVGSHPHVIQGIETYKGKNIIYSLGNFSFGANKNPDDKDTFIYKETFKLEDSKVSSTGSQVIPCSISSSKDRNTYQPTPLTGSEKERVLNRLKTYSSKFKQSYFK